MLRDELHDLSKKTKNSNIFVLSRSPTCGASPPNTKICPNTTAHAACMRALGCTGLATTASAHVISVTWRVPASTASVPWQVQVRESARDGVCSVAKQVKTDIMRVRERERKREREKEREREREREREKERERARERERVKLAWGIRQEWGL